MRIGLISDTHGLLRPAALEAMRGSDLIIHAGDVGAPGVLDELRAVAKLVAVRGNVDTAGWASSLPAATGVKAGAVMIYVLHDVKELAIDPVSAGYRIVVSGHSHKAARTQRGGVEYINPGSAGPRRFRLPVTVARLDLGATPWQVDFIAI